MKRVLLSVFILCLITSFSLGAPEPALVPGLDVWTLNTEFSPTPLQITLKGTDNNKFVRFWYIIVTITNKTDNDVDLHISSDLMTDIFDIIPAGKNIPSMVFNEIKKRHKLKYPFLELYGRTDNVILQGEDNTKDIAIIWPDFDKKTRKITIFISGLSNETSVVEHPLLKDETGKPIKIYLRKTLELTYALKGDLASGTNIGLSFLSKRWIMR
jgi:hypothetical protein